eukprot:scaffold4851_cov126-Isochrysis_galbana.AAC.2
MLPTCSHRHAQLRAGAGGPAAAFIRRQCPFSCSRALAVSGTSPDSRFPCCECSRHRSTPRSGDMFDKLSSDLLRKTRERMRMRQDTGRSTLYHAPLAD